MAHANKEGIIMNNFGNQTPDQTTNGSSSARVLGRRAFLGRMATGAALLAPGVALLADNGKVKNKKLSKGDAALLRFAAAAEILETDFWVQYNELAGIQDSEEPDGTGNPAYTTAVSQLD